MRRLPFLLLALTACLGGNPGDGKDDTFGGAGAKEDGTYSSCQLAEVIKLVNESGSTGDKLKEIGLSDDAAAAIVKHRNGPDGMPGTGDDDIYDDLNELDKVDYVGQMALGKLVESILPRCEIDLDTRPFIDSSTFAGTGTGGYSRNNQEVEVVLGVSGLTGQRLRSLLLQTDSEGRTLYQRVRRSHAMEAFTYDYPLDEIPWDSDTMAAREKMPLVSLTIESGRFEVDPESGERELSLGTDLMDDTYYDTPGYSLMGHDIELRGRARWDTPDMVRRLLIAAKFGTAVDDAGNKTNMKVDVRTDSASPAMIASLDTDVQRGKVSWSSTDAPVVPIKGLYEQMQMANALPDIGTHAKVLVVDPKAHLRSTRSRYHMNEARVENLRAIYTNATTRINGALSMIDKAQAAGTIATGDRATVDALEAKLRSVLDKSLYASRINAANASLGVTAANLVLPGAQTQPSTPADLEKNKVIAETINTVLHEVAADLDDADRIITGATDENFDDYAELFRDWRISLDKTFAKKTTWDSFVNSYTSLSTTANRAGSLAAFNTFIGSQASPLDDAGWTKLGNYLDKMVLTIAEHQIETAGIIARQLWFDQARAFYVPASSRAWSNFMIDTTDMVDMLSPEEWASIPEADRTFKQPLPATKVFNTVFVNELQVELGMEAAYVARIKEMAEKVAAAPTDTALAAQLEGAKFIWGQYVAAMQVLTELKGENVLKKLKSAGANQDIKWTAPPDSKGNQAMKILSDRD